MLTISSLPNKTALTQKPAKKGETRNSVEKGTNSEATILALVSHVPEIILSRDEEKKMEKSNKLLNKVYDARRKVRAGAIRDIGMARIYRGF